MSADLSAQNPTKIPYPDTLFTTKEEALRTKARIDQLNTRLDPALPVGGCGVEAQGAMTDVYPVNECASRGCASEPMPEGKPYPVKTADPSLYPGGEDAYYCEQLRSLLQSKVRRLDREREDLRRMMREIDQRQARLFQLIDDLR